MHPKTMGALGKESGPLEEGSTGAARYFRGGCPKTGKSDRCEAVPVVDRMSTQVTREAKGR